jgi:hypothetical protein
LLDAIRPVGGQATGGDERTVSVDRRQSVPGCKSDDQLAIKKDKPTQHDLTAIRRAREGVDRALHLAGIAVVNQAQLHPQR